MLKHENYSKDFNTMTLIFSILDISVQNYGKRKNY